eukprot:m.41706 g.41706  ORF g.41706 m.41706 type:complete len:323 (+) comp10604_c0_seq1:238-1206(+)
MGCPSITGRPFECLELADKLLETLSTHGLGAFDWETESAVPDEGRKHTKGTGNTKEHGVEVLLVEVVVLKEATTVCVNVWPWVGGLTLLGEDCWNNLVQLAHKVEELVVWQVLQGKLTLARVSWVSLTKDGMAVTWDNVTALKSIPDKLVKVITSPVVAELALHLGEPLKNFLVGETVKWTSKTSHTSGKGQVWVSQGRAHKMGCVSRHVAALVISMDGQVHAHQLDKIRVVVAEHVAEVGRPVERSVDWCDGAVSKCVAEDGGSHNWQLGHKVHGIFVVKLPVVLLLNSLLVVTLGKGRLGLKCRDGRDKLGHWVHSVWEA